ncbi:multidrug DMT transporter permease [Prolixibacter bellariivorans]|uniref:Multidrug DMT transporter permease n=1 Tax=Prolixibacter bellariivorans TaxID=314319 RepID=A0A5M4ATS6_9BACT|nr:GRP family sugar transporter [Prolixibacter bellariivorans]GET31302.1 multidrug DMT transporter permease [Prolixibacter bellariivorans]
MVLIGNYWLAVCAFVFCMTMWGSWSNTQKLAAKTWRFELFYWDFVLGLVLTALLWGFTFGTLGEHGRTFWADLQQADTQSIMYAMLGGLVWNIGNLLLVAAIAVAGMSVAFPIGGGIAWLGGIIFNFILEVYGGAKIEAIPTSMLFIGVGIIFVAIVLTMVAYKRLASQQKKPSAKGITLSVFAGLFIAFFYGLVVKSMDHQFVTGGTGNLGPYSGVFFFTLGAFLTTFVFNPFFMRKPVEGSPVKMRQYFAGSLKTHSIGVLGGFLWASGMVVSFMAVGAGDPAVSYALSNAAPVVAILWGVFVWKEFKGAPSGTNRILLIMFILFLIGLGIITASKVIG